MSFLRGLLQIANGGLELAAQQQQAPATKRTVKSAFQGCTPCQAHADADKMRKSLAAHGVGAKAKR